MEEKTQKLDYLLKIFKIKDTDREMLIEYILNHNLYAAIHTDIQGIATTLLWLQMIGSSIASKYIKCNFIGRKKTETYEIGIYVVSTPNYNYNFIVEL